MSERAKQYIAARIRIEDRGYVSPCWVWQQFVNPKGYAQTIVPDLGRRRIHRATYELYVGPIPDGLVIDHLCRVPSCCNPAHLEAVTDETNRLRSPNQSKPGDRRDHCVRGHDQAVNRLPGGGCRLCRVISNERYRTRKRSERTLETLT